MSAAIDTLAEPLRTTGTGAPVEAVTFGCRLNACESQAMLDQAAADGVTDAVVFNTCAVTAEAVRQARQAIRRARRERPEARLVVTGCAAEIDAAGFAAMAEVDAVIANASKTAAGALARWPVAARPETPIARTTTAGRRARAYVAIQNGCDHRCTFCVIPFGRGASRSKPTEVVAREVRTLALAGCAEVVLTGVDLTSWGADLAGQPTLGDLVAQILAEAPELRRLRLSSIDAAEIDPALIASLTHEPRLMPHLHLSLQSGDDLILKRMKRRHSRAQAMELIAQVRRARPDIAIGADLIAGFPTESEAAFDNTLAFVEEAGLAFLHVFPYSPRPMTPAARMPQHPPELIHARARRLRAAGAEALRRHLDRQLGRAVTCLVEKPGRARAADYTEIAFAGEAPAGSLILGQIAGHDGARARLGPWRAA